MVISTRKDVALPGLSQHPVPAPVASGGGQVWSARTGSDRARVSPLLRLQAPRLRAGLSQAGYDQTGHIQRWPPHGAGRLGPRCGCIHVVLRRHQHQGRSIQLSVTLLLPLWVRGVHSMALSRRASRTPLCEAFPTAAGL